MFVIEEAAEALEEAAGRVDPRALDGTRALALVEVLVKVERIAAAARTVVTRRVEETRAWRRTGHRSMAEWLAATNGTTVSEAIGSIETARSLEELPATEASFRAGDLSETQAREVTAGAIENPGAERSLLDTARAETVKTLRQRSRAVIAAATAEDEERERDAKVHRERYLRRWLDGDGALCLSGRMTADAGARLFAQVDGIAERLAKAAANDGIHERADALSADALVALADPGARTPAAVQLTVDAARLRHDSSAAGETCEIAGIGEVSVPAAERLLGSAVLTAIVRNGVDVTTISHPGRTLPIALERAVLARDPMCVVLGCDQRDHLEFDHVVPVNENGPTELANIARLCEWHHYLKTHRRYRLTGGPGNWAWHAPAGAEPERAPP
jgi:hypothetical protein